MSGELLNKRQFVEKLAEIYYKPHYVDLQGLAQMFASILKVDDDMICAVKPLEGEKRSLIEYSLSSDEDKKILKITIEDDLVSSVNAIEDVTEYDKMVAFFLGSLVGKKLVFNVADFKKGWVN